MFAVIRKGTESKTENVTMSLYISVIHTHFDYSVLFLLFLKGILKVENVQRRSAGMEALP